MGTLTRCPVGQPLLPTSGFSLLELIMVLLLTAVLLIVAAPRWPGEVLLAAQAERLAQDIRYTQALTMNRAQRYTIRSVSGSSYSIVDANNSPVLPDPPSLEGVTMDPFSCSFTTPMGAPDLSCAPIHLAMGGESMALLVTDLTGTVVIQP